MKTEFIKDLRGGVDADSLYAVRMKGTLNKYKGKPGMWFSLVVGDKTGELPMKYWGKSAEATKKLYDSLQAGDVVHVLGQLKEYQGQLEINVSEGLHQLDKSKAYEIEDFLETTEKNLDELKISLDKYIKSVKEPSLRKLLDSFFSDKEFYKNFCYMPAAMGNHHNYVGGLLEHTIGTTDICEHLAKFYPALDRGLIITASLLHDIGKIREYSVTTAITITDDGHLRGHIPMGDQMLMGKISEIKNFPENLALKLSHMLLSHHGELEWGSPKKPATPEAIALHMADNTDAKVKGFLQIEQSGEDPWVYSRKWERSIFFG